MRILIVTNRIAKSLGVETARDREEGELEQQLSPDVLLKEIAKREGEAKGEGE